jgi:hypothetical protein
MMGIGIFLLYLGYAVFYWGLNSMEKKPQDSFITYLFPFASGGGGTVSPSPDGAASPTGNSGNTARQTAGRNASSVTNKIKGQHL